MIRTTNGKILQTFDVNEVSGLTIYEDGKLVARIKPHRDTFIELARQLLNSAEHIERYPHWADTDTDTDKS